MPSVTTLTAVNRCEENNPSGIIGSGLRRSCRTNATPSSTPRTAEMPTAADTPADASVSA